MSGLRTMIDMRPDETLDALCGDCGRPCAYDNEGSYCLKCIHDAKHEDDWRTEEC